ncbi:MAG TPA: folylpolyglutamate synthase/dihydrofolate synthase family protein [Treponemataceae bacterium]|nr:folylpolyglutamate synthase/dihydrofolate synthase family protein [Treponemataceae bacterium]
MFPKRQTELFCEWLENFLDYERLPNKDGFSLKTMNFLVQRFQNPQKSFKSIHVAGSKGKGSVSSMIASILETADHKTGLYISPHLLDFSERITQAGIPFTEEIYGKAGDIVVPLVDSIIPATIPGQILPSWFELVTLFAFITFKEAGLPWAVIETGLGGRLDATNVINPEACVITPIELEHTEYLGDTLTKIATEKAGIFKKGVPVFISNQTGEAMKVLLEHASNLDSPVFRMDHLVKHLSAQTTKSGLDVSIEFNNIAGGAIFARPISTRLALSGLIQAENAALASYTIKYLFPEISESCIELGLSRAWIAGRFEIIKENPFIILDGAHTVKSIGLSLETFKSLSKGDAHLLFACAADKNVDSIASLFTEGFNRITITRPGEKKASDYVHAVKAFSYLHDKSKLVCNENYVEAITNAITVAQEEGVPLLITGSFYLVAEAKKILSLMNLDQKN